jgi:hypothetical protein
VQIEAWAKKYWKFLVLGVLVFIIFNPSIIGIKGLSGVGYLSGTQGLQPEFNSLYWNNAWWSNTERGAETIPGVSPSSMSFGWDMVFDPDRASEGMPDMGATEQAITVDPVAPLVTSWSVPQPNETLPNGTVVGVTKQFDLYRYTCDWAMNVWLSGSEWEADGKYTKVERGLGGSSEVAYVNPSYADSALWIKVSPTKFVYFTENPTHVYFAPAYIALKEPVIWAGVDNNGQTVVNDADVGKVEDLIPKNTGEPLGIYYNRGGTGTFNESTIQHYEGLTLDPSLFQDAYWTRISLIQFKPLSWTNNLFWHAWKYPSAYLHFQVYIYVVGEWKVYFQTGEIPALTPHTPIMETSNPLTNLFAGAAAWFASPFNQLWLFFILIVFVVVLVSIFNPGLWSMLALSRRKQE